MTTTLVPEMVMGSLLPLRKRVEASASERAEDAGHTISVAARASLHLAPMIRESCAALRGKRDEQAELRDSVAVLGELISTLQDAMVQISGDPGGDEAKAALNESLRQFRWLEQALLARVDELQGGPSTLSGRPIDNDAQYVDFDEAKAQILGGGKS